jgi:hypothetical protein
MLIGTSSAFDRSCKFDMTAASYRAGSMTLQLVRPDIRQSCILLAEVNSCANHSPTTSRTTAIANPAIAGRRFSGCSGSLIAGAPLHVTYSNGPDT